MNDQKWLRLICIGCIAVWVGVLLWAAGEVL